MSTFKEPETSKEEEIQRRTHKPFSVTEIGGKFSSVVGVEIERDSSDPDTFVYGKKCPYCSGYARRTSSEHDVHELACKLEFDLRVEDGPKPLPFVAAQEIMERYKDLEALPSRQKSVRGINKCRRVLGINSVIGVCLENNDVMSNGIIMPADVTTLDSQFFELFRKTTLIRVVRVSEQISRDEFGDYEYPYLKEWYDKIEVRGEPGPIIEITPNSGVPRKGENGEACIYVGAVNIWAEYDEPEEDDGAEGVNAIG